MGRELIEAYPVFKEALIECDGYIKGMGANWSIIGKSRKNTDQSYDSVTLTTHRSR